MFMKTTMQNIQLKKHQTKDKKKNYFVFQDSNPINT